MPSFPSGQYPETPHRAGGGTPAQPWCVKGKVLMEGFGGDPAVLQWGTGGKIRGYHHSNGRRWRWQCLGLSVYGRGLRVPQAEPTHGQCSHGSCLLRVAGAGGSTEPHIGVGCLWAYSSMSMGQESGTAAGKQASEHSLLSSAFTCAMPKSLLLSHLRPRKAPVLGPSSCVGDTSSSSSTSLPSASCSSAEMLTKFKSGDSTGVDSPSELVALAAAGEGSMSPSSSVPGAT